MPFWVLGGAALGSGLIGGLSSMSAADTQAAAAEQAAQLQYQMFQQTQGNLKPYMQTGGEANNALAQLLGLGPNGQFNPNAPLSAQYQAFQPLTAQTFQQSPGYKFELSQEQGAIQNSAAARGNAIGGNTLNALMSNAQGLASQDWANANSQNIANYQTGYNAFRGNQNYLLNALSGVAGSGQNAAANLGGLGEKAANNAGDYLTQGANAQAAGIMGVGNQIGGGINNLAALYQQYGTGGGLFGASDSWAGGATPAGYAG